MSALPCDPTHHQRSAYRCPSCTEPYCAEPSCLRPTCWDCGATLPDPDAAPRTSPDAIPAGALEAFAALLELVGSCGSVTAIRARPLPEQGDTRPLHFSATVRDPSHLEGVALQPWKDGGAHWFAKFRGWAVMGFVDSDRLPLWEAHVSAQNGRAA